jgi:hypothetical protein
VKWPLVPKTEFRRPKTELPSDRQGSTQTFRQKRSEPPPNGRIVIAGRWTRWYTPA